MSLSSSQPSRRPPDSSLARGYTWLEVAVLLLAAPLLIIPESFPVATAGALLALGTVWLFSVYIRPLPSTPFNFVFLFWGLAIILSILVSADAVETLPKATGLILGLGAWRLVVTIATSRRAIHVILGITLLISLGFSFIGLFSLQELAKIPALAMMNPIRSNAFSSLEGLVVHPNQLAGLITLFLPLLVSLLFAPPDELASPRWRFVLFMATLFTGWTMLVTQSRGGWIAMAAGLFILLALWALVLPNSRLRHALRFSIAALTISAMLILFWIGPDTIVELWVNPPQDTIVGKLTTLNFRKELWPWAVTAISEFPFTGVGLGAFRQVVFRLYPLTLPATFDVAHAHNIFLQTALDVGLPGLAIYGAILLVAAAVAWQVARDGLAYRAISLGILAGLAAHLVYGLADALALGSKPGLVFWLLLGLLAAMRRVTPILPIDIRPGGES